MTMGLRLESLAELFANAYFELNDRIGLRSHNTYVPCDGWRDNKGQNKPRRDR